MTGYKNLYEFNCKKYSYGSQRWLQLDKSAKEIKKGNFVILELDAAKREIEALKTSLKEEKIQKTQGRLL